MEQLQKDIDMLGKYVRKEEGNRAFYDEYASIFLFGTENQQEINRVVDYKDKDVLTVASSADQYVSAKYYGAKNCEIYDINRFTYYISYLKIAAIRCLDYEAFMRFMIPLRDGKQSKDFWSLQTFKRVLEELPSDVAYFWENALYLFKKHSLGNLTYITDRSARIENVKSGMPFYASQEEYYKLQAILRKQEYPKFYLSDLSKLANVVKGEFDFVYLSNIIECMVCEEISKYPSFVYVNEDSIELDKIREVTGQVMQLLRKNGSILMSYRANTNLDFSTDVLYHNDFFEAELVPSKMPPDENDYRKSENTDIVLTYTPSKNGLFL